MKALNGTVVVQDPAEAEVAYMPQQGINRVTPDLILTLSNVTDVIRRLC